MYIPKALRLKHRKSGLGLLSPKKPFLFVVKTSSRGSRKVGGAWVAVGLGGGEPRLRKSGGGWKNTTREKRRMCVVWGSALAKFGLGGGETFPRNF